MRAETSTQGSRVAIRLLLAVGKLAFAWGQHSRQRLVVRVDGDARPRVLNCDICPRYVAHMAGLFAVGFHTAAVLLVGHRDVAEEHVLNAAAAHAANRAAVPELKVAALDQDIPRAIAQTGRFDSH